jgi:hypothetical protein
MVKPAAGTARLQQSRQHSVVHGVNAVRFQPTGRPTLEGPRIVPPPEVLISAESMRTAESDWQPWDGTQYII